MNLLFLTIVLWAFAANLIGVRVELLALPFGGITKAAAIALGLYSLLSMAAYLHRFLKLDGFFLAMTGTLILAELSIPETLLGTSSLSGVSLYPGILTVSVCWAFAAFISWLGVILAKRLCGEHKLGRTLFEEAIGVIGGFLSLCFLIEYARFASA